MNNAIQDSKTVRCAFLKRTKDILEYFRNNSSIVIIKLCKNQKVKFSKRKV